MQTPETAKIKQNEWCVLNEDNQIRIGTGNDGGKTAKQPECSDYLKKNF